MRQTSRAYVAQIAASVIFGLSFLFSKLALNLTTPFVLLGVRFIVAFLVMNLLVLSGKVHLSLKGKPIRKLLMMGMIQPVFYYIVENYGIAMSSTSISGIILGTMPVSGLILAALLLHERCTPLQIVCAVGSVIGVVFTSTGGSGTSSLLGILLLVAASVSASLFNVISHSISDIFTPFERTYVMFALGCATYPAIALIQNRSDLSAILIPLQAPQFWVSIVYLAVVSSVCAFMLINYAVSYVSATMISMFANLSTVVSVLAGIFIMGDSFVPTQIVGIVIIAVCIFVATSPAKTSHPAEP